GSAGSYACVSAPASSAGGVVLCARAPLQPVKSMLAASHAARRILEDVAMSQFPFPPFPAMGRVTRSPGNFVARQSHGTLDWPLRACTHADAVLPTVFRRQNVMADSGTRNTPSRCGNRGENSEAVMRVLRSAALGCAVALTAASAYAQSVITRQIDDEP